MFFSLELSQVKFNGIISDPGIPTRHSQIPMHPHLFLLSLERERARIEGGVAERRGMGKAGTPVMLIYFTSN